MSTADDVFSKLRESVMLTDTLRETIREKRDVAERKVRDISRMLGALHTTRELSATISAVHAELKQVGPLLQAIEASVAQEAGSYYRYHDIWRNVLQTVTFIAVVTSFLDRDTLLNVHGVTDLVGVPFKLPLEDYLIGLCNAIAELPRLAMNRVTLSDIETARRCAVFANDVFEGFKQLNFRNDYLRKRYDGMKYDVKRTEEIMYDLSIRGLVKHNVNNEPVASHKKVDSKLPDENM